MMKILRLMRIRHYIKNLLIFLPLLFGGQLNNKDLFSRNMVGFFALCLLSSAVYILNDVIDIENDKKHPTKCRRPLASGEISIKKAILLFVILVLLAVVLVMTCDEGLKMGICLMIYLAINIAYSCKLKNIPILDITIIVAGFFIRVFMGSVLTGIEISGWLFLTIISGSFYLALGKRRNEIKQIADSDTREVLKYYNYEFLDKNMYMCMSLTNVFYALWAVDNSRYTMWTIPLVIIISMKYSLNIENDSDGDPTEVILHDKILLLLGFAYVVIMFMIIYIF